MKIFLLLTAIVVLLGFGFGTSIGWTQLPEAPMTTPAPAAWLPTAKTLDGGNQVFQTFNNCGPAALAMALSYYSIQVSQGELGEALRPYQNAVGNNDDKSVTFKELAAKAEEYRLKAYARPAGSIELLKEFINLGVPVITKTWLKADEDIGHYRVIKGYDESLGELIQDDSLQGANLSYTYEEFLNLWQGFNYEFLVLVPREKQTAAEAILGKITDEKTAWETALSMAEVQAVAEPMNVNTKFNTVVALVNLGRYREAIEAYEPIEFRLPGRMLWYQIEPILAYYQLGDGERVLTMTEQIITGDNRAFSELHYLRGLIYQQQNQSDLAQAAFEDAVRYNNSEYWKTNI